MYKVKLTKVRSNHNNLRTDEILGVTEKLPTKGEDFNLLGKGLEFGTRSVRTTPVEKIEQIDNEYLFHTRNSTYKLEVLEKLDENGKAKHLHRINKTFKKE